MSGSRADELALAVQRAWDWCRDDFEGEPAHRVRLLLEDDYRDLEGVTDADLSGTVLAVVMDRLSPTITRLAVAERAGSLAMLHACALADVETGRTAVLFGPSGTGKTTAARILGTEFGYLTDETAAIDGTRVLHYPKPLSVLTDGPVKRQLSPSELGLRRPGESCELRALVQLYRDHGHRGDPIVDELDTMEALVELVAQTSFSRQMERPLHRLAELATSVGGVRRVTYAEAASLLPVVRSLIGAES